MMIEPYEESMLDDLVRLALRAWEPVFESIRRTLDPELYRLFYPDWRVTQRRAVVSACTDEKVSVWVAAEGARVLGFVAVKVHVEDRMGEIHMIAVDPDSQRRGVGGKLVEHALDRLRAGGMTVAMVETGGDPGHGPARVLYEGRAFQPFPVVRYFKKL